MSRRFVHALLAFALLTFTACGDDDSNPDTDAGTASDGGTGTDAGSDTDGGSGPELLSLGSASDNGVTIEMLSQKALRVGLNPVFFRLTRGEDAITSMADFTLSPEMDMLDGDDHACPFVAPTSTANADGLFAGELVFPMPPRSATGERLGTWSLTVNVHDTDADTTHEVLFDDLDVGMGMRQMMPVGEPPDRVMYLTTLNFAAPPQVGLNEFTFTIHQRASLYDWPAQEDFGVVISVSPTSTGNVNPTHMVNGKYMGTVDLTGTSDVTFTISSGAGAELGSPTYPVTVE